jgi:hypothetical protein
MYWFLDMSLISDWLIGEKSFHCQDFLLGTYYFTHPLFPIGPHLAFTAGWFDMLSPPRGPLKATCLVKVNNFMDWWECNAEEEEETASKNLKVYGIIEVSGLLPYSTLSMTMLKKLKEQHWCNK